MSGIEEKVISLYARGMSTRDIHDQLQDLYGIEFIEQKSRNYPLGVFASHLIGYTRYNEEDDFEDIAFRGGLELKNANSLATKTAYELANKECQVKGTKIYVIAKFSEYESSLEVQDQILSINGFSTISFTL